MSDEQKKAEELLQQSKEQTRHGSDPTPRETENKLSLQEALLNAYEDLENGDLLETLTIRDDDLAVLLEALSETDELSALGDSAHRALGREEAQVKSKAGLLKALIRVVP